MVRASLVRGWVLLLVKAHAHRQHTALQAVLRALVMVSQEALKVRARQLVRQRLTELLALWPSYLGGRDGY
jgi:hypothetical protein